VSAAVTVQAGKSCGLRHVARVRAFCGYRSFSLPERPLPPEQTLVLVGRETMRVATWNTRWLSPRSRRRVAAVEEIRSWSADVVVFTEVDRQALGDLPGYIAAGGIDWGYPRSGSRYKVLLLGSTAWREVDALGHPGLPPGRFVAATMTTSLGDLRVLGVCIPWRDAHVRNGRRDRRPWQEHLMYLKVLRHVVARELHNGPLVVAGDFNQSFQSRRAPAPGREALALALEPLTVLTRGASCGERLLDHVAVGHPLTGGEVEVRCLAHREPVLSDHDAVVVEVDSSTGRP
jgi:endonuclease/exonuclease/phosphatase family metal-dependent hydrolase